MSELQEVEQLYERKRRELLGLEDEDSKEQGFVQKHLRALREALVGAVEEVMVGVTARIRSVLAASKPVEQALRRIAREIYREKAKWKGSESWSAAERRKNLKTVLDIETKIECLEAS